jgi:hypothetical protein
LVGCKIGYAIATASLVLALAGAVDAGPYKTPRTAFGAPDLQGLWDSDSLTTLQRPPELKSLIPTDAEARAYERQSNDKEQYTAQIKKAFPNAPDVGAAYTEYDDGKFHRLARIEGRPRSSILIDPPDGKVPLLAAVRAQLKTRRLQENRNFDAAEMRPLAERCIVIPGPPMLDGDTLQIVQTPDHVAINAESSQGARIVSLKDRTHGPAAIKGWMGDSIGWWEGDTLVVETTNFNPGMAHWTTGVRTPLSPTAKVTERFSRTSPTEMIYRFTVDDPVNYAAPWSGVLPLTAYGGRIFSYECHEGNYALANILAGARRVERDGGVPEALDGGDPPTPATPTPAK